MNHPLTPPPNPSARPAAALKEPAPANPAAGAPLILPCPAGSRIQLIAAAFFYSCDATVATRVPFVAIRRGATLFQVAPVGTALTAGVAIRAHPSLSGAQPVNIAAFSLQTIQLPDEMFLRVGED